MERNHFKSTTVHRYLITEIGRGRLETYAMRATPSAIHQYCKSKRALYGYEPGVGGDRSFDCFAVLWE